MPKSMFERWIVDEGKAALRDELKNTRWRWFDGERRARQRLYRSARTAFRPGSTFSGALRKRLNQLPLVIRACAVEIQQSGYRQLCTYDSEKFFAVVPRGIVQADFRSYLLKKLAEWPQVQHFRGLTERVIVATAAEAEVTLFNHLDKSSFLVDESGRGLIVEVDRGFAWRINGADGHYCYACSLDEDHKVDLTGRRERRTFLASIEEMARGQNVYLRRLRPAEIGEVVDAFKLRRLMGAALSTSQRKSARRERSEDPVTIDAR
jgi:hypothetical protein